MRHKTRVDIEGLRGLLEATTKVAPPLPWSDVEWWGNIIAADPKHGHLCRWSIGREAGALIVAAVNALPSLLDEVARARQLEKYASYEHEPKCAVLYDKYGGPELDCTCGLDAARGVE